jgi:single-strand DNA-binding protein
MIGVEGTIQTRNYTDKNGNQRKSVEVVANNVSFCGDKKNATEEATQPNLNIGTDEYDVIDDDGDLPF